MKASFALSIRVATLAVLSLMSVMLASAQGSSCPVSPAYSPDFSANQGCLTLNGSGGLPSFVAPVSPQPSVSKVLRLTTASGNLAASAWYQTPQIVTGGFTTTFSFQLGSTTTFNADGIAFIIQNSGLSALGPGGCGIGFGSSTSGCSTGAGIPNSVAIEFNTYPNGGGVDPSSDSVSIQNCGGITPNSVDASCSLKSIDLTGKTNLADGAVHVAAITYTTSTQSTCGTGGIQSCSTLKVVVDGVDLFPGGVLFDINSIGLSNSSAFVGFTAATGGGNDDQDILSWTFTPQGQSESGTVTPGQTDPTTFKIGGGFTGDNPTTGYEFSAQETNSAQTLQMVVTALPLTQQACYELIKVNPLFDGAKCFVYRNGGGQGHDAAVMFEVTCPPGGSCGSIANPFNADLGTHFAFSCSNNTPLHCGPPDETALSFGLPHLTPTDGLPSVGFLKGEGPDPLHPCTPNSDGITPLFQSNQINAFELGDTSGGAHSSSGGTTSCWVLTYHTPNETPGVTVTQPADGANYTQGQNTVANYSCSAVSTASNSSIGPYLTVASCNGFDSLAAGSLGNPVENGMQFDTSTLGPHYFTVQVQDSAANTNSRTVTYNVVAAPSISGPSSATFAVGSPGSVPISATGFPVPVLSEAGALPAGVTFVDKKNGTATLAGTPTVSGIYPITFTAQNGVGSPATLAFTLTVVASVPASGTKCNGVYNGTFKGNLAVTAGQNCVFVGGGITGSVTQTGGNLSLRNALVGGNIQILGGAFSLGPSVTIKGNLAVLSLPRSSIQNQVCGAAISGNVSVQLSSSPLVFGSGTSACPGNKVAGNVTVSNNLSTTAISNNTIGGGLLDVANLQSTQVFSNHIAGLLTCSLNVTITGGGNTATKKTGQCASF